MRGQNFNMASGIAPRSPLFIGFFSHTNHHRRQDQQQRRPRISSTSSSSTATTLSHGQNFLSSTSSAVMSQMWCVFLVWTLLSSVGCGNSGGIKGDGGGGILSGMVKMSAAAADAAGAPTDSVGSDSSSSSSSSSSASVASSSSSSSSASSPSSSSNSPQCVLKGRVYTERLWYGYLIDKAFHRDYAKIQYTISYPVSECCTNLLIYYDDQIKQLTPTMTCEQREKVLPSNNNQIIPLHTLNRTLGCRVWNETDEPYYVCVGERIFRSSGPRTWYFALSRCHARTPLTINYAFNVSGYYGDCEEDPLVRTYFPPSLKEDHSVYVSVSIASGVVAGVAFIAAVVFFALWFLARRRAANSKGSSVTSSQATMTQDDIFYVNPSLSEREQQEYGQSQASSENYYEVIPERRSYESINPHLLAATGGAGVVGPGGHHPLLHHHPGHPHHLNHHHLHPAHAHGPHGHATHPRQLHLHPHPHAAGPGGPAGGPGSPAGGAGTQVKESAFHRPHPATMGYPMFDDYPPPPYQPPRLIGGPKHHTLHHPTPHHHHSLSMTSRSRPPLLNPSLNPNPGHAASLSFPAVLPPAPVAVPTIAPTSVAAAINNNNTASGNNNNGNNSNNNISAASAISMNTTTNSVSLGETSA